MILLFLLITYYKEKYIMFVNNLVICYDIKVVTTFEHMPEILYPTRLLIDAQ